MICGWSLQQHTTGYHCNKLLIQSTGESSEQAFWHWMSHLSESVAMTPWSAMSFTILSVFELVNQVDRGLKWLTIQEDIQSYKASSHVSLICEIYKAYSSQFFTSSLHQSAWPAYLKIALCIPHLFVGQLVLFVHTYHICNNHVIYIVAMRLYFSPLWQLLSVATMNSSAQLWFQDRNQAGAI